MLVLEEVREGLPAGHKLDTLGKVKGTPFAIFWVSKGHTTHNFGCLHTIGVELLVFLK